MSAACHRWGVVERRYSYLSGKARTYVLSRHKTQMAANRALESHFGGPTSTCRVRRLTNPERGL